MVTAPRAAAAAARYAALGTEDRRVVDAVRRDGVAILHGLLTPAELAASRAEFDSLQLEAGAGSDDALENAGVRTVLCTCQHVPVGRTPALGGLAAHPRVVAIAEALLGDEAFVDLLRTCAFERGSWRSICSAKAMCTLAGSTGLPEGLLCAVDE